MPSILCPMNWKIQATTNMAAEIGSTRSPIACTAASASAMQMTIAITKLAERSNR